MVWILSFESFEKCLHAANVPLRLKFWLISLSDFLSGLRIRVWHVSLHRTQLLDWLLRKERCGQECQVKLSELLLPHL